jgi:hypothetical protein
MKIIVLVDDLFKIRDLEINFLVEKFFAIYSPFQMLKNILQYTDIVSLSFTAAESFSIMT